jgi:hypothetical protein
VITRTLASVSEGAVPARCRSGIAPQPVGTDAESTSRISLVPVYCAATADPAQRGNQPDVRDGVRPDVKRLDGEEDFAVLPRGSSDLRRRAAARAWADALRDRNPRRPVRLCKPAHAVSLCISIVVCSCDCTVLRLDTWQATCWHEISSLMLV